MSIVRKNVVPAIIALAYVFGFVLAFATPAKATTLRVVQTPTLHLYSGETISATTMRITPYPKDLDGTKLTITDFGTLPTVTVDPKLSGIEEIESFTAITDNGDNTATLSGLSRNLTSKYPYTTAGTGRSHGAGATVVFGNNPQVYGRLWAPENQATSTDILYFTSTFMPRFDVDPGAAAYTLAPTTVLIDAAQLNRSLAAGAVNATRFVQGLVQVAFRGQAASSTPLGSTGAFAVLTSDIATSSPSLAMSTSSVVMTRLDSRIAPIFFATTTDTTYTLGNLTVNATTTLSGVTLMAGFTSSASSTFSATSTFVGSQIGGNIVSIFTAGATIAAGDPITFASSTSRVYKVASNVASTTNFIGIAKTAATVGNTVYVQTSGVVTGLSGLTSGWIYANDSGALSSTVGTFEVYAGMAISSTQLFLDKGTASVHQYLGSCSSFPCTVPVYARQAVVSLNVHDGGSSTILQGNISLDVFGKTSDSIQMKNNNSGGGSQITVTGSASWSGGVISVSGDTPTGTVYFYR